MSFRVVNERKKVIAESLDLRALQQTYAMQIQPASLKNDLEKKGIKRWDFDDFPESVTQYVHGVQVQRFPALVDEQDSVAIVMFEQESMAVQAMHAGVRRLLMLALYQQVKLLNQQMQQNKAMMMQAALLGYAESIRQHVVEKVFDSVFLSANLPRTQKDFAACLEKGRAQVVVEGQRMVQAVNDALQAYARLTTVMQSSVAPQKKAMLDDVEHQLKHLIYNGFIVDMPAPWLRHVPRFLEAAVIRVEKSARDLAKDAQFTQQVQVFWQRYETRAKATAMGVHDDDLSQFRWMIEELRVSMFAQNLKTSMPISVKRLEKQWEKMR